MEPGLMSSMGTYCNGIDPSVVVSWAGRSANKRMLGEIQGTSIPSQSFHPKGLSLTTYQGENNNTFIGLIVQANTLVLVDSASAGGPVTQLAETPAVTDRIPGIC